jgi:4-amino-4-deoxy-L-arabinose transferase-like glycosyltransferase
MEVSSIAAHMARGQGFSSPFLYDTGPTAWIAPVYPFLVAGIFKIFGVYTNRSALVVIGLQCLMGAANAIAIDALGRRTLGREIGLWAAWIWALSPFFFRWPVAWIWDFAASALLLTTILVITLDAAESGTRKQWLLVGGLWGIAALTNPALLSVLPITLAYAAFRNYRSGIGPARNLSYSLLLVMLIISPWLIRNRIVFGQPVFLRSNFWFEFHLGNYHYSRGMGYLGFHPGANPRELRKYVSLGEPGYVQGSKQEAYKFIHQYPWEFLEDVRNRTVWFWDGTPMLYEADRWWRPWKFWPLSATAWLGMIFLLTRRPPGWELYATTMFVYPLPYYFVFAAPKYRHAIEPIILLLTVYLASTLWSEIRLLRAKPHTRART